MHTEKGKNVGVSFPTLIFYFWVKFTPSLSNHGAEEVLFVVTDRLFPVHTSVSYSPLWSTGKGRFVYDRSVGAEAKSKLKLQLQGSSAKGGAGYP